MIQSMTAFGRGSSPYEAGTWVVELKCVNSKFLDYQLRLPASLGALEERIKKHVAVRLSRGRVSLFINLNGAAAARQKLSLNLSLLAQYKKIAARLQKEMGDDFEKPGLSFLLNNRDVVISDEDAPDTEEIWQSLAPALEQALEEACAMRAAEGEYLARDLSQRLDLLAGLLEEMEGITPRIIANYQERLRERIAKLLDQGLPELEQRLAQEVAITADKCDISEELVRARSHLAQFRTFLQAAEPVGRKLDFLVQELNREANTMGSKSPDARAINLVVSLKAELERIREQVQNIE
jgi:uncharacterized protein (TIGR00255 family)